MTGIFSIIKWVLVILAAVIFITSTASFMSQSRDEWQDYYDNLMAGKENQKYEESLSLVFEDVSVKLNEGVCYYDNGKALVKKEDLQVTAIFSEKGKIIENEIDPSEYEMVVPDSFALTGGKVMIKYFYQPPMAEGAEVAPDPILRVAEIDIQLTPVAPVSLKVIDNPYKVCYIENTMFDPTGIKLEVEFNTGDKVVIDDNDISFVNVKLSKDTDSVNVFYTKSGVTADADIKITVKSENEYFDGEIVSIAPQDQMYFADGQNVSNAHIGVLATYKSGNRVILSADEYTVSSNVDRASLSEKCIFSIYLNDNPDINCVASAITYLSIEAENALLLGSGQHIVNLDGSSVTLVEGFADGDTMTFTLNSQSVAKGCFNIIIANNDVRAINISDIVSLKVNGRCYLVPSTSILPARSNGRGYDFVEVSLANVVLNEGNNVIELTFNNVGSSSLAIDKLGIVNVDEKLTIGEKVAQLKDNDADVLPNVGITPTVGFIGSINVNLGKDKVQLYSAGGVSDGKYIYVSMNGDQHLTTVISKVDPETYTVVAQTAAFSVGEANESNSALFILDDTLYCVIQNGKIVEIDLEKFVGFDYEVKNSNLSFDNYGTLIDATWDESAGRLAIITAGRKLYILNSSSIAYDKLQTVSLKSGADACSVTSDDKFIYVSYKSADGAANVDVDVFTWDGAQIGCIKICGFDMDGEKTFNVKAIYMHEGQLYAAISCWGSRNNKSFFTWKVDVDKIDLDS